MKALKNCFLLVMLALPCANAMSQVESEFKYIDTNVDENGKHMRSRYLTNPWFDNWSITLSGGAQTLVSGTKENNTGFDFGTARVTPAFEFAITKWFTPVVALRLGVQGLSLEEDFPKTNTWYHYVIKSENGINYYAQSYWHGDFLWNIENTIYGYRSNRIWNFSPYAHVGYLRLSHPDEPFFTNVYRDREFEFGFGLDNTIRLNNSLLLTADLRWGNIAGRFHDAYDGGRVNHFVVMGGVQYNLNRWFWGRSKGIEEDLASAKSDFENALADVNSAKAEADAAKRALESLQRENENLKNAVATVEECDCENLTLDEFNQRLRNAGLVVYYQINISKLNFSERHHLDEYVNATLADDPKHVFYLTGSADKGTGTMEINTRLSRERAQGIKKILMEEFKVPEGQIVIKATIVSDEHEDGSLDRCVLFENE